MGPLEKELARATQLSEADLAEKVKSAQLSDDPLDLLAFVTQEMYGPLFVAMRAAILRLAHEVDELREPER